MNWTDDLLLENASRDRGQLQLATYAISLSQGSTITARQIKVKTIKEYIYAIASFLALFSGTDFRYDSPSDKTFGRFLAPIYSDLERYETVPDRREPYTPEMHAHARQLAAPMRKKDHRSKIPALVDGFEMATMAGFRLTEWAQPANKHSVHSFLRNHLAHPNITTRALCPLDIRVETYSRRRFKGIQALLVPLEQVHKLWIKFRTQKNGHNGEERLFTRNPDADGVCFVASCYRALQRFKALMDLDPSLTEEHPLSCYWDGSSSSVHLVTATDIEDFMRSLAVTVHHFHPIKDKKELQKWSSHSLRVGACVALHAMGFSPLDIQWLLRWRSMAFMAYLRNNAGLADRHHRALDKAAGMPFLF